MPFSYAAAAAAAAAPAATLAVPAAPCRHEGSLLTTSNSTKSSAAITEPSICIPRLPPSFNDGQILEIVNELGIGDVENIDFIHKSDHTGSEYLMVFIHMSSWACDENATSIRMDLMNDEKIKIVYDDPHFCILSKSYSKRRSDRSNENRRQPNHKDEQIHKGRKTRRSRPNKKHEWNAFQKDERANCHDSAVSMKSRKNAFAILNVD